MEMRRRERKKFSPPPFLWRTNSACNNLDKYVRTSEGNWNGKTVKQMKREWRGEKERKKESKNPEC